MTREQFKLGHRLLVRQGSQSFNHVTEVVVAELCETCVKLIEKGNESWHDFNGATGISVKYWNLVEDLGEPAKNMVEGVGK